MTSGVEPLRVTGLSWGFAGLPVPLLNNLNFSLPTPGLYALVGPSGSGKSTLLSLLAGFHVAGPGKIFWSGHDFGAMDREQMRTFRRQSMGFVFQDSLLIPEFDVADNVGLRGMLAGETAAVVRRQAIEKLERLTLSSLATRQVTSLSAGEAMRVSLLRALSGGPGFLLADEPTGGLDRETARDVMELLIQEVRSGEVTALIATHDEEMVSLCDGVLRLQKGQVVS